MVLPRVSGGCSHVKAFLGPLGPVARNPSPPTRADKLLLAVGRRPQFLAAWTPPRGCMRVLQYDHWLLSGWVRTCLLVPRLVPSAVTGCPAYCEWGRAVGHERRKASLSGPPWRLQPHEMWDQENIVTELPWRSSG